MADKHPIKRCRHDTLPSNQNHQTILSNSNPNPLSQIPRSLGSLPTNSPYSLAYAPVHRSAFLTVTSRKRTRDSEPHHAESSAAGAKRVRLSLPDGHYDDHSQSPFNLRKEEKKRQAKVAAELNRDDKPKKIDRETLEHAWQKVYKRDDLLAYILRVYEQEVLETFGLDLARVRQAYIVPNADPHYQWTNSAIRQAYPPHSHPAWDIIPRDRLLAWADSPMFRRHRPRVESLDRDAEIRAAILSAPGAPVVGFNSAPLPTDDDEEEEEESVPGPSGTAHDDTHHVDPPSFPPSPTLLPSSPESTDNGTESEAGTPPPPPPSPRASSPPLRPTGAFYGRAMYRALFGY